jgi:hypothetical protein
MMLKASPESQAPMKRTWSLSRHWGLQSPVPRQLKLLHKALYIIVSRLCDTSNAARSWSHDNIFLERVLGYSTLYHDFLLEQILHKTFVSFDFEIWFWNPLYF